MGVGARDGYASKKNNISVSLCLHSLAWILDTGQSTQHFQNFSKPFLLQILVSPAGPVCRVGTALAALYYPSPLAPQVCCTDTCTHIYSTRPLHFFTQEVDQPFFCHGKNLTNRDFLATELLAEGNHLSNAVSSVKVLLKGKTSIEKSLLSGIFVIRAKRCF